jgi:hypothetical protein
LVAASVQETVCEPSAVGFTGPATAASLIAAGRIGRVSATAAPAASLASQCETDRLLLIRCSFMLLTLG